MDVETIIIGGGQGGLSAGYYLTQKGREHIILERADRPAHAWRNDRWDSFTLVTPNWTFQMPGAEYQGGDPDGFMPRNEIVRRFEAYIEQHHLPVQFGIDVQSVEQADTGFLVRTNSGDFKARKVIVATGLYQTPKIPPFSREIPHGILQLHSGQYRSPDALPPGAVLVAGSAQSGAQIAEELYQAGRTVYLSICSAGRAPRRYRGKDIFHWLHHSGFLSRTIERLPSAQARFAGNPHLSGKDGGHGLNLHRFYRDGVILAGRVRTAQDGRLHFAPDLKESLAKSDAFEVNLLKMVDDYIARSYTEAPEETVPILKDAYAASEVDTIDLAQANIGAVIWAMGYAFDFSMIKFPVFDSAGFPITTGGVTQTPGLSFSGLPWLPGQATGILLGVAEQAAKLTN